MSWRFAASVSTGVLALLASLAGCGQKGPLTLPPAAAAPAASAASGPGR